MAEKKLEDLSLCYSNLGFDDEPVAGPSAPAIHEKSKSDGADAEPVAGPSAPPIYEKAKSYEAGPTISPTAPVPQPDPGPKGLVYNPPSLVFEDIYEACVKYADKHCCYGKRFVNQMKLTEIVNKGVFHYRLESFGEKRESAKETVPYRGGSIDGPENGPPPDPWSMEAIPPTYYTKCSDRKVIPHTESVLRCGKCRGSGKVECGSCFGRGRKDCSSCSGRRRDRDGKSCSSCSGSGTEKCRSCDGSGEVKCSKCDGYGKLKDYRVLLVTWENHPSDFVSDTNNMPADLISKAEGIELLDKRDLSLGPITNAPDVSVNAASDRLLRAHTTSFPNEMIIGQRHFLRAVPFTRVTYQWKEMSGEFYVYGMNRKVYFEDYPQTCCCCTCC